MAPRNQFSKAYFTWIDKIDVKTQPEIDIKRFHPFRPMCRMDCTRSLRASTCR